MTEPFIRPGIFMEFGDLVAVQTTRRGGVSPAPWKSFNFGTNTGDDPENVKRNRRRLCALLDLDPSSLATAGQVHGTRVVHAVRGGLYPDCDAFVTATRGVFLGILTADCLPVLLHDPATGACGAAHAGWKGSAGNICAETLDAMRRAFGTRPSDCRAWVGTGITGTRYEVGAEVAERFAARYRRPAAPGKFFLDLAAVNVDQLKSAGLLSDRIGVSPFCTAGHNDRFYSYRGERGQTGRMLSLVGLRRIRTLC